MAKRSFDGPDTLEEQSEGEGTVQKVKNAVSDTAEKAQQKAEQVGPRGAGQNRREPRTGS